MYFERRGTSKRQPAEFVASLIAPDRKFLPTEEFLDAIDTELKAQIKVGIGRIAAQPAGLAGCSKSVPATRLREDAMTRARAAPGPYA